jgi:quercetin dioxygenase-like cupin family protein
MGEAKVQKAEVVKLLDLIAYQAGSVVSREIVSRPTGTATLFAFDAGQGLSEHTAPFDAMVCSTGKWRSPSRARSIH